MNERIKQLAEQANISYWPDPEVGSLSNSMVVRHELEKFAELIVRECADIDFYNLAGFDLHDHDRASQVIKEHFGVE